MIERLRVRIPAGAAGEFSSPESTLCADPVFGVRSNPGLLQWHVNDPAHSAKSAGGRLQPNTLSMKIVCKPQSLETIHKPKPLFTGDRSFSFDVHVQRCINKVNKMTGIINRTFIFFR